MYATSSETCTRCDAPFGDGPVCQQCGAPVPPGSESDTLVGRVLAGRYELESLVGEGAMGRVYRAKQTVINKPFAVKILAPHLMNDETSRARFAAEAHNSASLNHPNCVSVVDHGTEDGLTYIVMEFVQGVELAEIIEREAPLAKARVVDLTLQLLGALDEAHGLGILHRDLKPENVVVQQLRTHGELIKILDFGIATLMDTSNGMQKGLTAQGLICGTPEYMSPEQVRGQPLDGRSDLYAVGVILYQMLAGRLPFDAESAVDILHMHLHEEPIPPSQILGTEPDELEAVCLRAMAKDREARFATAEAFREEVAAAAAKAASPAIATCSGCGAEVAPHARFCSSCGAPRRKVQTAVAPGRPRRATRNSGLHAQIGPEQSSSTAEILVRQFPLPLVGRDGLLQGLDADLAARRPGVTARVLAAPRGMGKTRLADEIAERAYTGGWRVHYVANDPSGARTPLWPIQQMVAQMLEFDPDTVTTQDLGRAANLVGLGFEQLPGLAELYQLEGPAHDLEYEVRRRECLASAVQSMLDAARGEPLALVFDDIDLYDGLSREALRRLTEAHADSPVLVVLASAERQLNWLKADVLTVGPLQPGDVEEVCTQVCGGTRPDSTVPARMARRGPSSPLRVELQLRLWAAKIDCAEDADDAQLVVCRLQGLSSAARMVVEHAAILGERMAETDLGELLAAEPLAPKEVDLHRALSQLRAAGLLLLTAPGERAFSHRRVYEAVHASIDAERARQLHYRAARVYALAGRPAPVVGVHLLASGSAEAIATLEEAADQALRRFDAGSARNYLQAALTANGRRPPGTDQRADELRLARKYWEASAGTDASIEMIEAVRASLTGALDPEGETVLHRIKGRQLLRTKQYDEGAKELQASLAQAIAAGDLGAMLEAYGDLGELHARRGDPGRAIQELEEGLDICTMGEGPRAETDLSLCNYLLRMSKVLRAAGDPKGARVWCEHALYQAERRGEDLGRLRAHTHMAWVLRELSQVTLGAQHVARALEYARYFGDRRTTAELLMERGRERAAAGKADEARSVYEDARRLARTMGWLRGAGHAEQAIAMLDGSAAG